MKALSHRGARSTPAENLAPSSGHKHRPPRIPKENVDPIPGAVPSDASSPFRSPSSKPLTAKNRSPLPPRPPPSNPLKRKLSLETLPENGVPTSLSTDSGVQVWLVVRMRPVNKDEEEGEQIVQKISSSSVSILDHTFTFDSVADTGVYTDIFHLVGLPLVENCLAGFNSSIFAYGQTGSGKTYTMWGPPSALSEDESVGKERGLTPRVFERLFSRINEEQTKHSDKQLNYQCRCSFLEIYNEQITDLLEPNQKNLQIREDVRTGVYVDCLTEEYVCSTKDVLHLLMKGLANRRTGATSINAESSRSHCVFTCVVESRLKSIADGLSSLRTSRINLVDLAGSERQKLTGAAGERLKEAGNINRSLSQLGNLINILAEVSQSGKQRHIPYRDSKLTFLLQESLGGNAKLAMICAISPSQSCKSETFSTLRFAQGAKAIQNQAVVNEITQDDVNVLREQIRQLKDELLRMKSNGTSAENNGSYSTGWNARRSLNLLRMSLNRSALPIVKDDSDEEMEIDDEDVEKPCMETGALPTPDEDRLLGRLENFKEVSSCSKHQLVLGDAQPMQLSGFDFVNQACESMEVHAEKHDFVELEECKNNMTLDDDPAVGIDAEKTLVTPYCNLLSSGPLEEKAYESPDRMVSGDYKDALGTIPSSKSASASSLSIVPYETCSVLQPPSLSISPRVESCCRKSLRTSLSTSASQKHILQNVNSDREPLNLSFAESLNHKPVSDLIAPQTKNFCFIY
ncbi:putative plus-end-directed kinesin ATPase [Dioscorea sansibarensis]